MNYIKKFEFDILFECLVKIIYWEGWYSGDLFLIFMVVSKWRVVYYFNNLKMLWLKVFLESCMESLVY